MLGMEMMVKGLLAHAGTSPEEIIAQFKAGIAYAKSVDERVEKIERDIADIKKILLGAAVDFIEAPSTEIEEITNGTKIQQ